MQISKIGKQYLKNKINDKKTHERALEKFLMRNALTQEENIQFYRKCFNLETVVKNSTGHCKCS